MPYCAYCGTPVDAVSYAPCPRCGNPRNGAPRPAVAAGSNTALIIVGVLVGGLVVVAIIGILAAIAIPNLLTAMQRSKQKRTMADIRSVATAVEAYAVDNKQYPAADQLESAIVPKYIKTMPRLDGWAHPLKYECWNTAGTTVCTDYAIGSAGKDGTFEQPELKSYAGHKTATTNFDNDIVYVNGSFVEYPEGTQR